MTNGGFLTIFTGARMMTNFVKIRFTELMVGLKQKLTEARLSEENVHSSAEIIQGTFDNFYWTFVMAVVLRGVGHGGKIL
jgi:hypothetical protein